VSLAEGAVGSSRSEDFVEVRLPADGAYLSVLRTATAGLAARLDFTIDEIEDLRIAVDEACAMLLAQVVHDTELYCKFTLDAPTLTVEVTAPTRDGRVPARDTFAWTVLSALAGDVTATVDSDQHLTITLRKTAEGAA
jgi:serine/threonine-protein kinase RsbW